MELNRRRNPKVRGKVVRHSTNLGKVEAVKTGLNRALGNLIAVVDGDSWWMPDTLLKLVDYMLLNGKKAVTGYVHPSDRNAERARLMPILRKSKFWCGISIVYVISLNRVKTGERRSYYLLQNCFYACSEL